MTQIASVDYSTLRITLHVDTVTQGFDPALMHQEYRALRRTVEANRQYDPMVSFQGLQSKGGGNFTPGQTLLRAGVRIIPHDVDQQLDILNEILNIPDGLADRNVFDRTGVVSNVDIDPVYSPVEVREVASGSGLSPTQDTWLSEVHGGVSREVWLDTSLVSNGNGYQQTPYNNLTDAVDFAEANGLTALVILDDIVLDRNLKNFNVRGIGIPIVDTAGYDLKGVRFSQVKLEGNYTDQIIAQECVLLTNARLNGYFEKCALAGDLFCVPGGDVFMTGCGSAVPGLGRPTITMSSGGARVLLSVRNNDGGMTIKGCTHADDEVTVEVNRGSLTFDASNTGGSMVARTSGKFIDATAGATVTNENYAQEVWQMNRLDPDNPRDTDEDGTIRVGGNTITAATVGTTPNRTTTQTRQP